MGKTTSKQGEDEQVRTVYLALGMHGGFYNNTVTIESRTRMNDVEKRKFMKKG